MAKVSPIIVFANMLHEHGVGSRQAEAIKNEHHGDEAFQRRAEVVEQLFANRSRLMSELADAGGTRPATRARPRTAKA